MSDHAIIPRWQVNGVVFFVLKRNRIVARNLEKHGHKLGIPKQRCPLVPDGMSMASRLAVRENDRAGFANYEFEVARYLFDGEDQNVALTPHFGLSSAGLKVVYMIPSSADCQVVITDLDSLATKGVA